jgi:hypothetical protein
VRARFALVTDGIMLIVIFGIDVTVLGSRHKNDDRHHHQYCPSQSYLAFDGFKAVERIRTLISLLISRGGPRPAP